MRESPFADTDVEDIPAFLLPGPEDDPEPVEHAVVIPPYGTGERRYRRRQRRRSSTRRSMGLLVLAAAVVIGFVAVVLHPWHRAAAPGHHHRPAATRQAPLPSSAVLVQQDAQGNAASITLFVANPDTGGGHVVLIPPATMTEIPSFGLDGVGKALGLGGPALFQITLENLVGVPLPPVTVVNDSQLTAFVQAAGPFNVDVPARVEQTDPTGNVNVLWNAGPDTLAPSDVPRFLSVRGEGNDLARLARHQTFWTAYLSQLVHNPNAAASLPPDLARVVRPLAAGTASYDTLPVEAVDAGSGGDEVYKVRQADLDQLMGQLLPGVAPGRIRVQVLNGTGVIGASPRVTRRLIPVGGHVVLSGNADSFAYAQTQIVFYDRSQQQAAERVRQALGTGKLVLSRQPLDVVDVTVVIGKDFNG